MHRAMSEFEGKSGKHMLALRSSQLDPFRISAAENCDLTAWGKHQSEVHCGYKP